MVNEIQPGEVSRTDTKKFRGDHAICKYRYKVGVQEIEHVSVGKDLGVHADEELTFPEHICYNIKIAKALVGLIRRSFSYLGAITLNKLFAALVVSGVCTECVVSTSHEIH